MKLYVASSWRNDIQPAVVEQLRADGHEVYDFRNPKPGNHGFHWSDIDPEWKTWNPEQFRKSLEHPVAISGFSSDWGAMQWADAGVMVMPCGRSAHIEAGYFVGAHKPLFILLSDGEPELMYKMATRICLSIDEVSDALKGGPITITSAEVKRRAKILGSDYDNSIAALIAEMQPILEYTIANIYLSDTTNTHLQAILKLGMLEIITGEFIEQINREDNASLNGVDLIQQGAARLSPYLNSIPIKYAEVQRG